MPQNNLTFEQEEDLRRKFIAILLSGSNRPIKSKVSFQKELFIFLKSFPQLFEFFGFKPHFYGPYSRSADDIIENYGDLFSHNRSGIGLTDDGKELGKNALNELSPQKREKVLDSLKLVRSLFDELSDDELMFLVYLTYGYTEKSEVIDRLMNQRQYLADNLLAKGIITKKRYQEIMDA